MELAFSSLGQLAARLDDGTLGAVELTQHYLDRIAAGDGGLHAYVHVDADAALRQAQAAQTRRDAGYALGPLDGVPIAIKDLCDVAGQVTTGGSAAWRERVRQETATSVQRLLQAGMVVLGKLHMVEFAFGGWGLNPRMGTPVNPWGLPQARIPGGSSSGSGVAVAAGLAPAALGSDTGGSVRIPAALNGVTGLKTTTGLISRHGAVPLSQTLDSIGFLARTAEDAWRLSRLSSGYDARDPATWSIPPATDMAQWRRAQPLQGIHLALMDLEQFPVPASEAVLQAYDQARKVFQSLGATCETYRLPFDFNALMRANGTIIAAESYAYHQAYIADAGLPFGDGVRGRILNGRQVDAASYIGALQYHETVRRQWYDWVQAHGDALLMPTLPCTACRIDEVDETSMALASFTRAANFMNAVALSLPAGFSDDGLPVGVQLLGAPLSEPRLAAIGAAFQQETDWHLRRPDLRAVGL